MHCPLYVRRFIVVIFYATDYASFAADWKALYIITGLRTAVASTYKTSSLPCKYDEALLFGDI